MNSIEERVIELVRERGRVGIREYGHPLDDSPLSFKELLTYAQEEAVDFVKYVEKIKGISMVALSPAFQKYLEAMTALGLDTSDIEQTMNSQITEIEKQLIHEMERRIQSKCIRNMSHPVQSQGII